jgi:hypothetical protein
MQLPVAFVGVVQLFSEMGEIYRYIHYNKEAFLLWILGWIEIERDFFLELRVAWGLKNYVLVPVNPFRNIFVFSLG